MLTLATLQTSFVNMLDPDGGGFLGFPATVNIAVDNFADAYDTYAVQAQDIAGNTLVSGNKAGFTLALLTGLAGSITADAAAQAFDDAFVAYWTGAVFTVLPGLLPPSGVGGNGIFGLVLTSAVTLVTTGNLKAQLLPEFNILSTDGVTKAASLATIFHAAAASSIIVTISGSDTTAPPAGPLPIINTNTVY